MGRLRLWRKIWKQGEYRTVRPVPVQDDSEWLVSQRYGLVVRMEIDPPKDTKMSNEAFMEDMKSIMHDLWSQMPEVGYELGYGDS